jgi:hypothetical protein
LLSHEFACNIISGDRSVHITTLSPFLYIYPAKTATDYDLLTPGRNAKISGGKLKVEGTDPACGVYFVNEADGARVKVDEADIVENLNAHLLIIVPALPAGTYRLEVTTQYGGSSKPLKAPRTAVFDRLLTVAV